MLCVAFRILFTIVLQPLLRCCTQISPEVLSTAMCP